jgi:hypothetical protein
MTAADVERLRGHCQHTTNSIWELQGLLESQTEENTVLKQQLHAAHIAYETLQREQQHSHKGTLEHLSTAKGRQHEHMKVLRKLDEARAQLDDQTVKLVEAAALQEALFHMEHKLAITYNSTTATTTASTASTATDTVAGTAAAGSSVNSGSDVSGVTQLPLQQLPSAHDRLQAVYDRAKLQGKLEGLATKANKAKQQQQQTNPVKRKTSVTVTATAAATAVATASQQLSSIRRASSKRRLSTVNLTAASSNSDSNAGDSDASSTQQQQQQQQQQQRSVKRGKSAASLPSVQEAAAAEALVRNGSANGRIGSSNDNGKNNGSRRSSVRAATATPAHRRASSQPAIELKQRVSQVVPVKLAEVARATATTATASTQTIVSDEQLPARPAVQSKHRSKDHAVQCDILSSTTTSSSSDSAVSMRLPPVVSPIRQPVSSTQQRHSVSVKRINVDTYAVIPDAVTAQLRPTAVSPLALAVSAKPSIAQSDAPTLAQQAEVVEAEPFHVQKHKLRKWQPHDVAAPVAPVSPRFDSNSNSNSNNNSSSSSAQVTASVQHVKQLTDSTSAQLLSDATHTASAHANVSDNSGSHSAGTDSVAASTNKSQHSPATVKHQQQQHQHQQQQQQQQQQQRRQTQVVEDSNTCDDSSVGDYCSVHSASQFAAASTVSTMSNALSDNMLFITVMQESSGSYALKTLLQELLSLCTAVLQPSDGHVSHKVLMHHATVLHSTGVPLLKRILRGYGLVSTRWNHVSCHDTLLLSCSTLMSHVQSYC